MPLPCLFAFFLVMSKGLATLFLVNDSFKLLSLSVMCILMVFFLKLNRGM